MNNLLLYVESLKRFVETKLWAKVFVALILGVIMGLALSYFEPFIGKQKTQIIAKYISFPGKLFIKLIQMIMIALIVSSIITGILGSNIEQLKIIGARSLLYFVGTTIIAVSIGMVLTTVIQPGSFMPKGHFGTDIPNLNNSENMVFSFENLPDAILTLIPENPLEAMITGDMLSVVIFAMIIGIAAIQLEKEYASLVLNMMHSTQKICMSIVNMAMRIVPFAVFGIIAGLIITVGKESLSGLSVYVLTVLLGLFIISFFYLLLVSVLGKQSPFRFLAKIKEALLLAFSTTSSAAVMPLSLKIAEKDLKVKPNVSNIIIPLGSTINMDGTALYQCVSFMFIIQVYGIDMSLAMILLSAVTIVLASIGTPAVPGAGIIVLASVLQNAGIPAEGLMIIIGVERIMGMFRAAVNTMGDLTACVVFDRYLSR